MSSLKFGTSGLRGLVPDLAGEPARRWLAAFLRHLDRQGVAGRSLFIGRDLRASSPSIAADCVAAALASGWEPVDCGALPTPALALASWKAGAAAVMVTGSHIPEDRNGLKFYTAEGEITKDDEAGIREAFQSPPVGSAAAAGAAPRDGAAEALSAYRSRYLDFFAPDCLAGLTVGIYQQSSVGRDVIAGILQGLGAVTMPFDRADRFIPVDTEAHRPEDLDLLRRRARENALHAVVSADGDADRPLVADAQGGVVRGDLLGLLTASFLKLGTIVTPITSSAAVETSGIAGTVLRTRVGSPFVIEAMQRAQASGARDVIGFEANGGVLLGSRVEAGGRAIDALPTRDAVLPIVCALALARSKGRTLRRTVDDLGAGHALSDRLKEVGSERSGPLLARLSGDGAYADAFFEDAGRIAARNDLDGVRFALTDGSTVHFRASGNAPEFRCYVEAASEGRAAGLLLWGLTKARAAMNV